jgi:hypothetical protein
MNLAELLGEELAGSGEPDIQVLRFVLRRLGQLGDASLLDEVLDQIDALHHVFPDVIRYLGGLRQLSLDDCAGVGQKVLALPRESIIGELEYHRMWALDLFAGSTRWGCEEEFMNFLVETRDDHTKRRVILATGRAGQQYSFQSQWRGVFDWPLWSRRAPLAARSCSPPDTRQ